MKNNLKYFFLFAFLLVFILLITFHKVVGSTRAFAYTAIGKYHQSRHNFKAARNAYLASIKLDSLNYKTYLNLANCYTVYKFSGGLSEFRNDDSALINYNRAILIGKSNWETYNARGFYLITVNKYIEAIEDFDKSIKLDSSQIRPIIFRALCYEKLNKYSEARNDYNKILAIKDNLKVKEKIKYLDSLEYLNKEGN